MKGVHVVSWVLLVVGGLNWGLMGVGLGNVLESILGSGLSTIVYILVGLAAVYDLFNHRSYCKNCGKGSMGGGAM